MRKLFFIISVFYQAFLLTQPITFEAPILLSNATQVSSEISFVAAPNGELTAAWLQGVGLGVRTRPSGGAWGALIEGLVGITDILLGVDQNGGLIAAFIQSGVVNASFRPFGGAFGAITTLSGAGSSNLALTVDPITGNAVAAWVDAMGDVETHSRPFGGPWAGVTETLTGNTPNTIAIDSQNDDVVILWEGQSVGTNVIYASQKTFGMAWAASAIISDTAHEAVQPSMAFDSSENLVAAWFSYDDGINGEFENVTPNMIIRPSGGGVGAIISLEEKGLISPNFLKIKPLYDIEDNVFLTYTNSIQEEDLFQVKSALFSPEEEILSTEVITHQNLYILSFDTVMDVNGNIFIMFMSYNESTDTIDLLLRGNVTPSISIPRWLERGDLVNTFNNGFLALTVTNTGSDNELAAAWLRNDGGNTSVYSSLGTYNVLDPPTGLTGQQLTDDFGIFTETYNELDWTDSIASDVKLYSIHRDGYFIASVLPGVETYIDHNQPVGSSSNYDIYAVDEDGDASPAASVTVP